METKRGCTNLQIAIQTFLVALLGMFLALACSELTTEQSPTVAPPQTPTGASQSTPTVAPPQTPTGASQSTPTVASPQTPTGATAPTRIAIAIQSCFQEPECRLDVSSDQLRKLYTSSSTWILDEEEGIDGQRLYSALSYDGQISVTWVNHNGVVFVEMLTSASNAMNDWSVPSVHSELRSLLTAVVPPPWRHDYSSSIMGIWFGLGSNPATRSSPPGDIVDGVIIQSNYLSDSSAMTVTFWACSQSLLGDRCQE